MSTESITFSKIAATLPIPTWEFCPGEHIVFQAEIHNTRSDVADAIFKKFINDKIPKAQGLVSNLILKGNISEIHVSFSLKTIFFIFIDDLIEHYQNQLEQRDDEIDQELLRIKYCLANNITEVWPRECIEIQNFLNLLKDKLISVDAIPSKFDEIVKNWSELLSIQYMGLMTLGSIFITDNRIYNGLTHRLPRSSEAQAAALDSLKTHPPRSTIEESFALLSRQLSRDISWVIPEMTAKLQPLNDESLEKDFTKLTAGYEEQKGNSVSVLFQNYETQMRELLGQLSTLDITDNEQIDNVKNSSNQINSIVCSKHKDWGHVLKLLVANKKNDFEEEGIRLHVDHPLFQPLKNFSECVRLKYNYLELLTLSFRRISSALKESNSAWAAYKNDGTVPKLGAKMLYLEEELEKKANAMAEELLAEETNKRARKKTQKKRGGYAPTKKEQSPNGKNDKPLGKKKSLAVPALPAFPLFSSAEALKGKLLKHHQQNPSAALRQAIWHLDHLIVMQDTFKDSTFSSPQFLNAVCATAGSAQKTLEQIYRHALKEEGIPATHHLKTYHWKFEPNFKSYPPIVKELFLAHKWTRDFYPCHDKWGSVSTFAVKVPPILTHLVKIAEGSVYAKQEVETIVNATVEDVCKQMESVLPVPDEVSTPVPYEKIHLEMPLQEKLFSEAGKKLEELLPRSKSTPPVYLHVKQALAALKMLDCSVEQINKAKDHREFSTWAVWSMQQLQESIENLLHCMEHYQSGKISTEHELKTLLKKCNMEMDPLAEKVHQLAYKVRYPAVISNDSFSSQIINDLQALKEHPELEKGFEFQTLPKMVWGIPSKEISLNRNVAQLQQLLLEGEVFLRMKAIPALQAAGQSKKKL